ncbi:MAG: Uma2 family endonuclease [Gammaproteobacteria bacterium]
MSVAMEDWPRRHRITVDEYHRMAESGSFAPDARVELIDGVIIDMPPIGSPHAAIGSRLEALLGQAVAGRAIVRCQWPIHLGDDSEPQPDLALVLPRDDFYEKRHPTPTDTLLVVEVSATTLGDDLWQKMRLYARHGITEYWVVDVTNRRLHVFRQPDGAGYERTSSSDRPGAVEITALSGVSVDLSSLFHAG